MVFWCLRRWYSSSPTSLSSSISPFPPWAITSLTYAIHSIASRFRSANDLPVSFAVSSSCSKTSTAQLTASPRVFNSERNSATSVSISMRVLGSHGGRSTTSSEVEDTRREDGPSPRSSAREIAELFQEELRISVCGSSGRFF